MKNFTRLTSALSSVTRPLTSSDEKNDVSKTQVVFDPNFLNFVESSRQLTLSHYRRTLLIHMILEIVSITICVLGVMLFAIGIYTVVTKEVDHGVITTITGAITSLISALFFKPIKRVRKKLEADREELNSHMAIDLQIRMICAIPNPVIRQEESLKFITYHRLNFMK